MSVSSEKCKIPLGRCYNIDIVKTVAIYLIVLLHVGSSYSGIQVDANHGWLRVLQCVVSLVGDCGVDLFALATGYLCIMSNSRLGRVVELWLQVVFWGVVVLLGCRFCCGLHPDFNDYLAAFSPLYHGCYWYFCSYFLLTLVMPLINVGIRGLSKRLYFYLMLLLYLFCCVFSVFGKDVFKLNGGHSFAWLFIVYLFGAYFRLYGVPKIRLGLALLGMLTILCAASLRWCLVFGLDFHVPGDSLVVSSSVSPFVFVLAILIFVVCFNVRCAGKWTFLPVVSSASFGVYLINVQPFFWTNVWRKYLNGIVFESAIGYLSFSLFFRQVYLFVLSRWITCA